MQLDPSAGHLGNYLSKFNAAHSVTCCFSSIRNVSLNKKPSAGDTCRVLPSV